MRDVGLARALGDRAHLTAVLGKERDDEVGLAELGLPKRERPHAVREATDLRAAPRLERVEDLDARGGADAGRTGLDHGKRGVEVADAARGLHADVRVPRSDA